MKTAAENNDDETQIVHPLIVFPWRRQLLERTTVSMEADEGQNMRLRKKISGLELRGLICLYFENQS